MIFYIQTLRKYAVFDGRASRNEYWIFVLFNILIAFAISFLEGLVSGSGKLGLASHNYELAVAIPFAAVYVRRLHDGGEVAGGLWCQS